MAKRRTSGAAPRTSQRAPSAGGPLIGRLSFLGLAIAGAFLVIALQLFKLQVIDAPRLSARATDQHHKTVRLSGERGTITDRNGAILAKNMNVPSLSANPSAVDNPKKAARTLARVLPVSAKSIEKKLRDEDTHFTWLHRHTNPATAEKVMALKLAGIHQVPESRRFYPKGNMFGHLIGFSGIDNQGLAGLELTFDRHLKGREVVFVVARDALGRSVFPAENVYEQPDHGADLVLTVDEVIQYHVERELDKLVAASHPKGASVVVMEPRTGEILALGVRPRFDPNRPRAFTPDQFRNRVVTDPYEPGSTMKMFLAATALENKAVTLDELIDCENGRMPLRGGAMHDSHPYGELTFAQVLAKSSNIGSAKVAMRMGPERLRAGLARFGFGRPTGIALSAESAGVLPPVSRWSSRSLASIAIGQELSVTPLQLITAAAAIANGGWLMRPYLVREIHDTDTTTIIEPKKIRRAVSAEVAARLRETLVAVTEKGGTAPRAAIPGYRVAGKTGTAQKAATDRRGYARGKFISSFVGMVPADAPRLVILVVVDEPQGKYYGGTVAAPIFREIARPVLQYLGVHPETDRTLVLTKTAL